MSSDTEAHFSHNSKVEQKDVLGNIKGTFGFVDANGEIKRVSYSSSNGTGFKATTLSPLQEHISVVQSIPRLNRTSTTRRPTVIYATTTDSSIKAIPTKPRKPTISPSTSTTTETPTKPLYRQYSRTTARTRPKFIINGQQRPLALEDDPDPDDSQINRPSTDDKSNYRRIVFTKRPPDQNLRPITEDLENLDEDGKLFTGNTLRRQLPETGSKSSSTIMESSHDDHADVFGGALSTTRPLFTTNSVPRILQRVTGGRTERPKPVFLNRDNVGPARFEEAKYEGGQVFESDAKNSNEERDPPQQILIRTTTKAPLESRDYVRQSSEPVYVHQQPEAYERQPVPEGILVRAPANHPEDQGYRAVPISRLLYRPNQQYTSTTDASLHYLTERPDPETVNEPRVAASPSGFVRARPVYQRPIAYAPEQDPRRPVLMRPSPHPDEREYQTTPEYYKASTIALPPEPPNPIAPPLSRRDFQVLLKKLLISQYGVQALNYPKAYLEDALYDQQPYPSYHRVYQSTVPREDIYESTTVPGRYGDRVALRRPGYVRAIYAPNQYEEYPEGRYAKRVYRQRLYTQDVADEGDEVLPPPVREALLLRMLQLAINSDRAHTENSMIVSTTPGYRKAPVRSVQIISADEDEKDIVITKKI